MEWAIGIPIVALLLLCPLMMVGMIIGGWLLGRKAMGGHGGHGMMCMGHGSHAGHDARAEMPGTLVDELKAERERLDRLITAAEDETRAG